MVRRRIKYLTISPAMSENPNGGQSFAVGGGGCGGGGGGRDAPRLSLDPCLRQIINNIVFGPYYPNSSGRVHTGQGTDPRRHIELGQAVWRGIYANKSKRHFIFPTQLNTFLNSS